MRKSSLILFLAIGLIACNPNNGPEQTDEVIADSSQREPLYPYPQYIQGQIEYLDSAMLAIERVEKINGKTTDSGFIDRATFKEIAREFLEPDPNKTALRPQYTENSFQDLSLNTITFSIEAKNKELELQQVDVLLNPTNNQVKNIIIKKNIRLSELQITHQMLWVHNMYFQIASLYKPERGAEMEKVIRVTWDKPMKNK